MKNPGTAHTKPSRLTLPMSQPRISSAMSAMGPMKSKTTNPSPPQNNQKRAMLNCLDSAMRKTVIPMMMPIH